MDITTAIEKAGSITALARTLGVTRQAVQQFRKTGVLPPGRVLQLMREHPGWFKKPRVKRVNIAPESANGAVR